MKKQLFLILFNASFLINLFSQTAEQKWNINIYGAKNDYIGSYSKSNRVFNSFFSNSGIQYSRYINKKFDYLVEFNHGVWGFSAADNDVFINRGFRSIAASLNYRFTR